MKVFGKIQRKIAFLREELFWRHWFTTKGISSAVPLDQLLDPNLPFPELLRPFAESLPHDVLKVLDVGAGPCTHIGRKHPSKTIEVTATDILASRYQKIMDGRKIVPPVQTVYADAEALTKTFPKKFFDMAVANNSLDHCATPFKAIQEMLEVVKTGGYVILRHRENEAVRAKYHGLHQWNFLLAEGKTILWSRHEKIDLSGAFATYATINIVPDPEHVIMVMRKMEEPAC